MPECIQRSCLSIIKVWAHLLQALCRRRCCKWHQLVNVQWGMVCKSKKPTGWAYELENRENTTSWARGLWNHGYYIQPSPRRARCINIMWIKKKETDVFLISLIFELRKKCWRQPGLQRRTSHSTSASGIIRTTKYNIAFSTRFFPRSWINFVLTRIYWLVFPGQWPLPRHVGDDWNPEATKQILNLLEVKHITGQSRIRKNIYIWSVIWGNRAIHIRE